MDADDIRITIYDSSGDAVDSFTDTYFGRQKPENLPQNNYYGVMSVLLEGARRSATGADKIVDSILKKLGTPSVTDHPASDLDEEVPF